MVKFNVHEPAVQAAMIEVAGRISANRKGTAEETAAIAKELLAILAAKPEEAAYAPLPPNG